MFDSDVFRIILATGDRVTAENEINSMMHFNEELKMWFCGQCKMYSHPMRQVVFKHIDSKHLDYWYKCDFCEKLCPTQHANGLKFLYAGVRASESKLARGIDHLWSWARFTTAQMLAINFANRASWQKLLPKFERP